MEGRTPLLISLRMAGVCGRTLRKKTSLAIIIIVSFSLSLLHVAKNSGRTEGGIDEETIRGEGRAGSVTRDEELEEEDEVITPDLILNVLNLLKDSTGTIQDQCNRMVRLGGVVTCKCNKKNSCPPDCDTTKDHCSVDCKLQKSNCSSDCGLQNVNCPPDCDQRNNTCSEDCDPKRNGTCYTDGAKSVCLDPGVRPVPGRCLALNFGIGFDLSFDAAMVEYGCRVVAFDPTNSNMTDRVYQATLTQSIDKEQAKTRPFIPGRTLPYTLAEARSDSHHREFHALDAGLSVKDETLVLNLTIDSIHYSRNVASFFKYKTVMEILDHPRVDLLKLDIEGAEWDVLEEVLSLPDARELLRSVRQIILEMHFEFLNAHSDTEDILDGTWRTMRILQQLRKFGFTIAAFDLNDIGQKFYVFQSVKVPIYREITLIKRGPV